MAVAGGSATTQVTGPESFDSWPMTTQEDPDSVMFDAFVAFKCRCAVSLVYEHCKVSEVLQWFAHMAIWMIAKLGICFLCLI